MKPINEMTKRELLDFAQSKGIVLSSATRLNREDLARAIRKMLQDRYRAENP